MKNPVLTTVTTYVRTYMREVQLSTVKFGLKSVLQIHPKQVPRCKKKGHVPNCSTCNCIRLIVLCSEV